MQQDAEFLRTIEDTIPRYFLEQARARGGKVAMRAKRFGVWEAISWTDYLDRAERVGNALLALGLTRGDTSAIISENRPEWLFADIGAMLAGAVSAGIYTTDSAKQVDYIVNDCQARILFAENDEQLDKILTVRDRCPTLLRIVVFDLSGLRDFSDPQVMGFEELLDLGARFRAENPGRLEAEAMAAAPDDTAILIYTSGTTGPSKGAMLNHRNLMCSLQLGVPGFEIGPDDEQLSFLPLCHIVERNFGVILPLRNGSVVNFAESPEAVPENIRELQPTYFFGVPRIWEKFYSGVSIRMKEATWFGRMAYALALAIGARHAAARLEWRTPPLTDRILFWLADQLVLRNIKRSIGLDRARFCLSGAAPISPDLLRWLMSHGVNINEAYGMTESTGIMTVQPYGRVKLGTVGTPVPYGEVRLGAGGEILYRGPNIFQGYLNKPDKTEEALVDGWLHTGDVGVMDKDGYIRITDRMKDIIITAGGKNITPSEIENQLKFSPYISDAVVIGDRRKYLTCLIMIDHENVLKFAQDNNIPFSNFASLCRAPEVVQLVAAEVEKVNRNFARVETIKEFRLIDQQLTAEDDELTPTMKLKRKFVNEKYKPLIDSMYRAA
jgi:long-chain acyl-CoA synthetase